MGVLEPQFHGTPRFRIVSRIGVGAVGELYKAMDETRGTFVALRTLRNVSRSAGEELKQDFLALKAVRNSSLVTLGDIDQVDGVWLIGRPQRAQRAPVDSDSDAFELTRLRPGPLRRRGPRPSRFPRPGACR